MGAKHEGPPIDASAVPSFDGLIIRANSLNYAARQHFQDQLIGREADTSFDEEISRALRRKEAKATRDFLEAQRDDVITSLAAQQKILGQLIAEGHMSARVRDRFAHTISDLRGGVVIDGYRADRPQLAFPDAVLFPKAEEEPVESTNEYDIVIPEWLRKAMLERQENGQLEQPDKRPWRGIAAISRIVLLFFSQATRI